MKEALRHAEARRPLDTGCRGRSEHAGLAGTIFALNHRGLRQDMRITETRRQLLAKVSKGAVGG